MGKDILTNCPLCKNHCSVDKLKCNRGKAYVKKNLKDSSLENAPKNNISSSSKRISIEENNSDELLCSLLRRSYHLAKSRYHHKYNIHSKYINVLFAIYNRGSIIQKELSEFLSIKPDSLKELLKKLEKNNYIVRQKDQDDKLNSVITLTDEGRIFVEKNLKTENSEEQSAFNSLTEDEKAELINLLKKLTDGLESDLDNNHKFKSRHKHLKCNHNVAITYHHSYNISSNKTSPKPDENKSEE